MLLLSRDSYISIIVTVIIVIDEHHHRYTQGEVPHILFAPRTDLEAPIRLLQVAEPPPPAITSLEAGNEEAHLNENNSHRLSIYQFKCLVTSHHR
jgi:hypothetical protein